MSELTLAWAALFVLRAAVYAVLICLGQASGWLAAASIAMGWPAFGLLLFASYRYVPKRLEQLGAPDPRHRSARADSLSAPVDVGPVALQRAQPRALAGRDQRRRPHAHVHPVRREHVERALGDPHLPERGRVHVVGHHEVARAEVAQVEHERAVPRPRLDRPRWPRSTAAPARGRPRSSGIVTTSTPVAALGQRGERRRVVGARTRPASQSGARTSLTPAYRQPRS